MKQKWWVYLIHSVVQDVFYTGITLDVPRRLWEHNEGKGAKYTRGRGPWHLVARRRYDSKGEALRVEARLKRLRHEDKHHLGVVKALMESPSC
jgi:predicted GIY-YIG superfamily endonuclease